MAHFTRTQTDATWTVGGAGFYVPSLPDWQSLADKQFKSMNGDRGGCWAPTSPIIIDTSGMLVSGPARVDYGGTLKTTASSRFVLGNGEWPSLSATHVGRTRRILQNVNARMSSPRYHWADAPTYPGSIQTMACTILGASGLEQPKCTIPLQLHNGARLKSVTLTFRVPTTRASAPKRMPRMRVVRTDKDGNLATLTSSAGGADVAGYLSQTKVTSADAWYANGAAQTWTIPCDQNNTVDTSLYVYWVEIIEEIGTDVVGTRTSVADGIVMRERKQVVLHVFTANIATIGNPGLGLVTGNSVLVQNNTIKQQNGLYTVNTAGPWPRRTDLASGADFTPWFLVEDAETRTSWECTSPVNGQTIAVTSDASGTEIAFQRRQPRGNIYHSLVVDFDSISDMRPQ